VTAPALARELVVVPMTSIDPPALDARLDRDPAELEALGRDMITRGQIEPIKLARVGERLEMIDGFSRYKAAQLVGMTELEAFVYPSKLAAVESIKYRANAFRLEMSVADEAAYFYARFNDDCGRDIEKVAAAVNRNVSYVDNRLQLLLGDDLVFEALRDKKIKIGVAQELNKISDPTWVRYYLEHAIASGATVAVVTGWVQEWRNMFSGPQRPALPDQPSSGGAPPAAYDPHRCYVCQKSDPRRMTVEVRVHQSCLEAILDPMLAPIHGDDASRE